MKKTFGLTLILFVLSSTIFILRAQTYRIEAGYSQPRIYSSEISHRYFQGIRLGATVDFEVPQANFLGIHTGLFYSHTFGNDAQKHRYTSISDSIRINTQGHYLDIPLHVTASYNIFKKVKAFAFAGPNFNIGLYMPQSVETTITDGTGLQFIEEFGYRLGSSNLYDGRLRRFNLQFEAGGGVQWWKIQVKGGYSFGINNLSKLDFHKQRQSGWFASIAYEF